jgi:DNA gyrase subunit A
VALVSLDPEAPPLAIGTRDGVVKRIAIEPLASKTTWSIIALRDGDAVVGAAHCPDDAELVFVTTSAQLLRFGAATVRPQGRSAGGMAGIRLGNDENVIFFGVIDSLQRDSVQVVTISGSTSWLAGTQAGNAKVCEFSEFPAKGRATGGVRAHRFLKGEDTLILAWVGSSPPRAVGTSGQPLDLPVQLGRRDGSGEALHNVVAALG